jgi:SpoVK/Ycf46/Vps4 family AAA+-type ATPase
LPESIVIIIDEIHKLFEHHDSDNADDSQSAAAFWLAIDQMEKHCSHTILICTANDISKLPAELQSRFAGKVIDMQAPDRKQKVKAFKQTIRHDKLICLDRNIDNTFIIKIINQLQNCSLRDIRLLIDTAKMFYYEENPSYNEDYPMFLTKKHFQLALAQIQTGSSMFKMNLSQQLKKLEPWALAFGIISNISVIAKTLYDFYLINRGLNF